MQHPDYYSLVDSVIESLGGNPSADEVEAAAVNALDNTAFRVDATASSGMHIRAVICSISLSGCTSRRPPTQRARVYDRIRRSGDALTLALHSVSSQLGIPLPVLELTTRDCTSLLSGHDTSEILNMAAAMNQACIDVGASEISGPFLDLSLDESTPYLDILPELLAVSGKCIPLLQIGTNQHPPDPDVIRSLALSLGIHRHNPVSAGNRVAVLVNGCDRRAFGQRVHADVDALSISYEHGCDVQTAFDFSVALSTATAESVKTVHFEERLPGNERVGRVMPNPGNHRGVATSVLLDGFPVIGTFQNRVSLPDDYDPTRMIDFLISRLNPSASIGQEAGVVIEFRI